MQSNNYKKYARVERGIVVEETFNKGMQYTNTPLDEGYCRTLVNFDFKDQGRILAPRGGYKPLPDATQPVRDDTERLRLLHTDQVINMLDDENHRYVLAIPDSDDNDYLFNDAVIMVETGFEDDTPQLIRADVQDLGNWHVRLAPKQTAVSLHGMPLTRHQPRDMHVALNNSVYLPLPGSFGKLYIDQADPDDAFTFKLERLTPYEPTPTEAVNYGYNMLQEYPYSFPDQQVANLPAGMIRCTGLLPYKDITAQELLFNAPIGSYVTFKLVCEWANQTDKFKFKWEIMDLDSDARTVYEEPSETSKTYHFNGTNAVDEDGNPHVSLTLQPPYRRIGIIVTAYAYDAIDEPLQTAVLPSYMLTNESNVSIAVKNYDLSTATGMCTWGQRMVVWGVSGAKNVLFVSAPSDPSYFPYPHNCDIVKGQIVACVEHMGDLLVWTDSQLLKMEWDEEGMGYGHTVVQDNLMLTPFDAETIQTVGNMIYFKNGNYYFMIVPTVNISNPLGTLTLAPVSTPAVVNLLDNFEQAVLELVTTIYKPLRFNELTADEEYGVRLSSYHNYTDAACIRNVYKMRLTAENAEQESYRNILDFDFILNYDTMQRAWSIYLMEGNRTYLLPYIKSSTNNTLFLNLTNEPDMIEVMLPNGTYTEVAGYKQRLEIVRPEAKDCSDTFTLDRGVLAQGRRIKNWQLLDTGYRNHSVHMKKRFREVQFKIHNKSGRTLEFGTEFILDDDVRKTLFTYKATASTLGEVLIERSYANPELVPGTTALDIQSTPPFPQAVLKSEDVLESSRWALDVSQLGPGTQYKVRFPVSGKGHAPRLLLLSFNEQPYELLSNSWVGREMNGR